MTRRPGRGWPACKRATSRTACSDYRCPTRSPGSGRPVRAETTALVVAHRASTVLLADKVALLDGGAITHVGRHHDLLAAVPHYRELLAQDADLDPSEGALR